MKRLAICVLASVPAFYPQATGQSGMISMPAGPEPEHPKPSTTQRLQLAENYGKLPLSFEANIGQADKRVRFFSRGIGYGLYLTDQEAVLELRKGGCPGDKNTASSVRQPGLSHNDAACVRQTALVRMRLEGSSGAAVPEAEEQLPGTVNRFIGSAKPLYPCSWSRSRHRRMVWSLTPIISTASYHRIFFAMAFSGTSCSLIIRSTSAAG